MSSNLIPNQRLIKPFYASFDGLRACAFLAVFTWHVSQAMPVHRGWLYWGWSGVDLFFVLSGFLITGILLDTTSKPHFFKNFYSRRALRIFPVFYGFWLLLLLLTPLLHFEWNRYVVATAFYFGNFFYPGYNFGLHASPGYMHYTIFGRHAYLFFDHFWSLCVEEQFYLIWPAVIWFVRSRRALLTICLVGIIATPCLRLTIFHFHPEQLAALGLYCPTYARCDSLFTGAALAIWLRLPGTVSHPALRRNALIVLACSLAALVTLVKLDPNPAPFPLLDNIVATVGFTLIAFAAGSLLVYCLFEHTLLSRLLQWKPLQAIGRLSYGMYVYHEFFFPPLAPFLLVLRRHHLAALYPVIIFVLTLFVAYLSFRFLESPFLRLKRDLAPRPDAIPDPPPVYQPLPDQASAPSLQPITMDVRP